MKKRITILLIVVGMLISAGGCGSSIAGSTLLKVAVISGMAGTTTVITFDKEMYEVLKNCDWFMIDSVQYMPESYLE